jgi:hypothetical protein
VAIRDFLKKRARYLRLVAQNNMADGVNVTPITVVASIDPELLENHIDMEMIDADSVDYCTDESVMEYLESMQERDASVTAEYFMAEILARAVADNCSLHRNLRLDFNQWQAAENRRASCVGKQSGHSHVFDREQTRDE